MYQSPLSRPTDVAAGILAIALVCIIGMVLQNHANEKRRECVTACVLACPAESPESCRAACAPQ